MLPNSVQEVLCIFSNAGYEVYVVGGCVRDLLQGNNVHDYDIATNALPEQVCAIFPSVIPTGLQHGTVTVRHNHHSFEVTTFRLEGIYSDGRRPDTVSYETDLIGDLSRRDFTINAMAMDENEQLFDPFDGQKDLSRRLVRCVGDPNVRFQEDGLRILRGVRFAARFGFEIEAATKAAMLRHSRMLHQISVERIREELCGILLAPYLEQGNLIFSLELFSRSGDLTRFSHYPNEILPRLAALCSQLEDGELPKRFKFDRKTISAITIAAEEQASPPSTDADWRRIISLRGEPAAYALAGWLDQIPSFLAVNRQTFPRKVTELALSSQDLINLGHQGAALGQVQQFLLRDTLKHPEHNTRENLLALEASFRS